MQEKPKAAGTLLAAVIVLAASGLIAWALYALFESPGFRAGGTEPPEFTEELPEDFGEEETPALPSEKPAAAQAEKTAPAAPPEKTPPAPAPEKKAK